MTIHEAYRRIKAIQDGLSSTIEQAVSENSDVLVELNRNQLLHGRNNESMVLTPGYTEDPYFKTPEAAQRYQKMKEALEAQHRSLMYVPQLFPDKGRNTPNLIVTGPFQNSMFATVGGGKYTIDSSYIDTKDIESKYGNKVFGLATRSKQYMYFGFIRPDIFEKLIKPRFKTKMANNGL